MSEQSSVVHDLISQLKQERDELRLKIHLGKQEVQDELDSLQVKLDGLSDRYAPLKDAVDETAEDVWDSLKLVGSEISDGFNRIRKAL